MPAVEVDGLEAEQPVLPLEHDREHAVVAEELLDERRDPIDGRPGPARRGNRPRRVRRDRTPRVGAGRSSRAPSRPARRRRRCADRSVVTAYRLPGANGSGRAMSVGVIDASHSRQESLNDVMSSSATATSRSRSDIASASPRPSEPDSHSCPHALVGARTPRTAAIEEGRSPARARRSPQGVRASCCIVPRWRTVPWALRRCRCSTGDAESTSSTRRCAASRRRPERSASRLARAPRRPVRVARAEPCP